MLGNYLAAACRNIWRNRQYAAINIVGLAAGFTAGLLIALFVNDEESYDRFWPHYQQVYMVSSALRLPGAAPLTVDLVPGQVIVLLRKRLPAGAVIARSVSGSHVFRAAEIEASENVKWADPALFAVLTPALVAGDLDGALQRPDALVLTQHIARKYFGDASPLGRLVEIDHKHTLRVTAVVRDTPSNSFLNADVFGSARASFAGLGALDAAGAGDTDIEAYVRLPPQFSARDAQAALQAAALEYMASRFGQGASLAVALLSVADIHLSPAPFGSVKPRGDPQLLHALMLIGAAIVAIAAVNFVNLMTARAGRRFTEIGVRKALGAGRRDLIVQFMGESLLYSLAAMLVALALVELLLPAFNGFLQRDISLDYGRDLAFCLLVVVLVGVGAGFYPALVLARFTPIAVLRGAPEHAGSGGSPRQLLVVLQFAVLIGLFVATLVVYRQVEFALNEGLRLDKDQALVIMNACEGSFPVEVRKLPGVRSAACSEGAPLGMHVFVGPAQAPDGAQITVRSEAVEPGLLELYGLHPIAGRFFEPTRTAAGLATGDDDAFIGPVVINETAVRKLHFATPQAALGQVLRHPGSSTQHSEIIGVVADVPVDSVRSPVAATVFHTAAAHFDRLSVKLAGRQIPQTLRSIDELWKRSGASGPIARLFVDQVMQDRYLAEVRQGQMFAAFACVGLFIACLGLFGLAAFTAERRTKEIGMRKAMGATQGEIVRMLLWQLTRPVLVANLIAWPAGFYLMSRWLQGFAYHIKLELWMFLAAGALALAIAWLTVSTHAYLVARQRPASALRYE